MICDHLFEPELSKYVPLQLSLQARGVQNLDVCTQLLLVRKSCDPRVEADLLESELRVVTPLTPQQFALSNTKLLVLVNCFCQLSSLTAMRPETMPAAKFRVCQDNAAKFQHNKELTQRRKRRLEEAGAFRAPTNKKLRGTAFAHMPSDDANAFRRAFSFLARCLATSHWNSAFDRYTPLSGLVRCRAGQEMKLECGIAH